MTETRPVWLLDIDGVLNAYARGRTTRSANPWAAWHATQNPLPGFSGPSTVPSGSRAVTYRRREVSNGAELEEYRRTYRFFMHPGQVAFVHAMAEAGVEVRWCTTWGHRANSEVAPTFGLPKDLPVEDPRQDWGWKQAAAGHWARTGRAVIWTDDDEVGPQERAWFADHAERTGAPHLLLAPDPLYGLTPEDCQAIAAFVAKVAGR